MLGVNLKRFRFTLLAGLIFAALLPCLPSCGVAKALYYRHQIKVELRTIAQAPPAHLDRTGCCMPVLHLYGTHQEMGDQYGRLLKGPLQSLLAYARALVPADKLEEYRRYARQHEPYLPQQFRQEIQAAAAAADVPYTDLLMLSIVPRMACSMLAVWRHATQDGQLIMGRNSEYFGMGLADRASLIVVYHERDQIPVVAISFLGMFGSFTGMNARGVAFGNLLVRNACSPEINDRGLPIQLALRLAAQSCADANAMVQALSDMPRAIPMNVMVADKDHALVVEMDLYAETVIEGDGILAQTNYFQRRPGRMIDGNDWRYSVLLKKAREADGSMNVQKMEHLLDLVKDRSLNLQAAVFEPGAMRMHISLNTQGPAASGPYYTLDVRSLFNEEPLDVHLPPATTPDYK